MSRQVTLTEQLASPEVQDAHFRQSTLSDYWALTKPEVNVLILITTGVGFYLGCGNEGRPLSFGGLVNTLLGTLLVASGTGTLNQYVERTFDAQMRRTARRPAAAGRLKPAAVLAFGLALASAGSVYLAVAVNPLSSVLAILTLLTYLFLYTPLKRKTPMCVLVGAFPGAMPPLIGFAGASGRLNVEAGLLYAMLFFGSSHISWQSLGCTAKTMTAPAIWFCPRAMREFLSRLWKPSRRSLLSSRLASCNLRHGTRRLFTVP
jgi:heme O synthase-like polyprenyltransferase